MTRLWRRLQYLLHQRERERELDDEIEHHRALTAERLERAGLTPQEAKVAARLRLLEWLESMGLNELPRAEEISDHFVAACAAALAAWRWSAGSAAWCYPAQPPEHPYDFAC